MSNIETELTQDEIEDRWFLSNRLDWMTDNQWECMQLLGDLFLGFHHMNISNVKPSGNGIAYTVYHWTPATFDCNDLTRLVKLSHDWCIRSSLTAVRNGVMKIELYKRKREGAMHQRHPMWKDVA